MEQYIDKTKEILVKQILDLKSGGMTVGIYGYDVCEICGKHKMFRGWIDAGFFHHGKMYICRDCHRAIVGARDSYVTSFGARSKKVVKMIRQRGYRHCVICCEKVPQEDPNAITFDRLMGERILCSKCQERYRGQNMEDVLDRRRREIYLYDKGHEALFVMLRDLKRMKKEMDSMWNKQ